MARRQQEYTLGRVFVGDRPIEDLTPEERTAFRRRTVQRMGEVFNNYFSHHPDVYVHVCEKYAVRDAAQDQPKEHCHERITVTLSCEFLDDNRKA